MNREATFKISAYLPSGILTNEELAALYPGWTAEKILEKTGIHTRHVSGDDETAGDFCGESR